MTDFDWSRFCKRITVNADVQTVYDFWIKQENLERWFLRLAKFTASNGTARQGSEPIEEGDSYLWKWHGYSDEVVEYGNILVANGFDFLQFSFSKCKVSVKVQVEDSETVVELWQENIPVDEQGTTNIYLGCSEGWTFYLANLKSIVEGGIDLRNKNEHIKKVISS